MLFYVKSEYPPQLPPLGRGTVAIWEWMTAGTGFQLVTAASAARAPPGYKQHEKHCMPPVRPFCSFIRLIFFAGCVIDKAGGVRDCVFRSFTSRQVNKLRRCAPHAGRRQSIPWQTIARISIQVFQHNT